MVGQEASKVSQRERERERINNPKDFYPVTNVLSPKRVSSAGDQAFMTGARGRHVTFRA